MVYVVRSKPIPNQIRLITICCREITEPRAQKVAIFESRIRLACLTLAILAEVAAQKKSVYVISQSLDIYFPD